MICLTSNTLHRQKNSLLSHTLYTEKNSLVMLQLTSCGQRTQSLVLVPDLIRNLYSFHHKHPELGLVQFIEQFG